MLFPPSSDQQPGSGSIFWGQGSLYESIVISLHPRIHPTCMKGRGVVEHPQGTPCLPFYTSLASGNIPDFAKQRSTTAKTGKVPAAKMRAPARTSSETINQLMYQYNQRKPTKSWYKKYPITGWHLRCSQNMTQADPGVTQKIQGIEEARFETINVQLLPREMATSKKYHDALTPQPTNHQYP